PAELSARCRRRALAWRARQGGEQDPDNPRTTAPRMLPSRASPPFPPQRAPRRPHLLSSRVTPTQAPEAVHASRRGRQESSSVRSVRALLPSLNPRAPPLKPGPPPFFPQSSRRRGLPPFFLAELEREGEEERKRRGGEGGSHRKDLSAADAVDPEPPREEQDPEALPPRRRLRQVPEHRVVLCLTFTTPPTAVAAQEEPERKEPFTDRDVVVREPSLPPHQVSPASPRHGIDILSHSDPSDPRETRRTRTTSTTSTTLKRRTRTILQFVSCRLGLVAQVRVRKRVVLLRSSAACGEARR
ncbi:unnamed protein product, partial [Urochloa humidicola]